MELLSYTELTEQRGRIAIRRITTHFTKFALQFTYSHTVLLGKIGLCIDLLTLLGDSPQFGMSHHHGIQNGLLIELELVLFEHSHTLAGCDLHGSLIGFDLSAEDLEEGTLTCPVGTDDAVTVAFGEIQVHFLEEDAFSVGEFDVFYRNHGEG